MLFASFLVAASAAAPALALEARASVPSLDVPACPSKGTVMYDKSVPDKTAFPPTVVDVCYDATALHLTFTAYDETHFFFNPDFATNDKIFEYEVMEAFVARGTADPTTYLELEVAPNNVTFQAFIANPSGTAPTDTTYLDWPADGIIASTTLDRAKHTWTSELSVPLALFDVSEGEAKGTQWRMNFFRTVVDPATFPAQTLGAWNPPDKASFHITPFFGNVNFV